MTDNDKLALSRRKVLAGLGTIGLASAGVGLGTSAYFSDVETFSNNVLTAGALDLVVDWEEHYYYDQDDLSELDIRYSIEDLTDDEQAMYVGFPDPESPLVFVHMDDVDGIQDDLNIEFYNACEDFAQMDENLDPTNGRGAGKRTANADTILNYDAFMEGATPEIAPLVNLHDVKPGDFGELTLSTHLCDNPGYLWLQGELVDWSEGSPMYTEPEMKDPDEDGAETPTVDDIELLDAVQTMLWYDEDGDNIFDPAGQVGDEADVVIVMDTSGSMGGQKIANAKAGAEALVDAVGSNVRIGIVEFSTQESLVQELTTDKTALKAAIQGLGTGGTTNIEGGINGARDILTPGGDVSVEVDPTVTADPNTANIMVLLSDGQPNVDDDGDGAGDPGTFDSLGGSDPSDQALAAKNDGIEMYTIAYGVSGGSTLALLMEDLASSPKEQYAYLAADIDEVEAIFAQIGQILAGEQTFFRGTLRELLTLVETDLGIPLDGIRSTPFEEVVEVNGAFELGEYADPGREEYVNSTNNFIGLAWWLPVDHANEIQTDSVTFDLGFYTEQARHNDGSGQEPEAQA
jgi:predicted ribosomally synthesized peptide with SipW-like signal peptide